MSCLHCSGQPDPAGACRRHRRAPVLYPVFGVREADAYGEDHMLLIAESIGVEPEEMLRDAMRMMRRLEEVEGGPGMR